MDNILIHRLSNLPYKRISWYWKLNEYHNIHQELNLIKNLPLHLYDYQHSSGGYNTMIRLTSRFFFNCSICSKSYYDDNNNGYYSKDNDLFLLNKLLDISNLQLCPSCLDNYQTLTVPVSVPEIKYNFALNPYEMQPSGHINFTRLNQVTMNMNLSHNRTEDSCLSPNLIKEISKLNKNIKSLKDSTIYNF